MLKFDVVTIFPDFFRGPFEHGIIRRAQIAGLVSIGVHDLRAFTSDRHKTVDDRPFGGGEGMVLKPEPIFACVESLGVKSQEERMKSASETVILLSPAGEMFDQKMAAKLAQFERVVLICGRYEGVDERVAEHLADREVSVGNFVLSGGELGAAIIVDAVTRLVPGALGNEDSNRQESFTAAEARERAERETPSSTCGSGGLLDYPHYTRPADFRGYTVPEVLANGDHKQIRIWRRRKALEKTLKARPDLVERLSESALDAEDRKILAELRRELPKRAKTV
jgi:tRNA (guanine37-N1)-methyltransferase